MNTPIYPEIRTSKYPEYTEYECFVKTNSGVYTKVKRTFIKDQENREHFIWLCQETIEKYIPLPEEFRDVFGNKYNWTEQEMIDLKYKV